MSEFVPSPCFEDTFSASLIPTSISQCIELDDVHGGNHLYLIVTPGGSVDWIRNVATQFTPKIGQSFATLDECIQFYETYADTCGFEPRKSSTKRFRGNGDIKTKLIVCNREGYRDSQPKVLPYNGEAEKRRMKPYDPRKTKITRIGCKVKILFRFVIKEIDQVKVPLFVVDHFYVAHNYLLCPLKYKEFQNKSRHLNLHHKQTIIDIYKVNIDPTTTLRSYKEYVDGYQNAGAARRNYSLYGEVVTFNPTYSTNRYDIKFCPFTGEDHHIKSVTFAASLVGRESSKNFNWVFQKFLDYMGGKEPNFLFTDQCLAMTTVVPAVFKTAAHRYCMWHIMQKLPEKVGTTMTKETDFLSRMNSIVWDSDLEPFDFEVKWSAFINEFQLEDSGRLTYMFNNRQCWIPAYYRDIPFGCLLRTTQRSKTMNNFFKRFENPHGTLVKFWFGFHSAMDQQRYTHKSFDRNNDYSPPLTKTIFHLEIHASTVYTHELFYEFQKQCVASLHSCSTGDSSRDSTTRYLYVEDAILRTTYTVAFNPTTFDAK
ncbi:protein FAR1-RELATED SEQUENCE 5-like [Silene latifolia]|uniref:protein FAR1-RELATED SEQUENCE 5-like n=1 Tax=Silene latifolia TaxID=37657 RepID=UPI003D77217D